MLARDVQRAYSSERQPESSARMNHEEQRVSSLMAWWKLIGAFLVLFNIWGLPISFGAFQGYYTLQYLSDDSASTISWIGTVQGALLVMVGLISGPLYDLGYWRHLFISGTILTVLGMMMLSLSLKYYQVFLSQGVCVGIGCGLLYIPTLSLISSAFSHKRALVMGVITSGIAFGGVVLTIAYIRLLPELGFPWMVRSIAFINLIAFLIAAPALIRKTPTSTSARTLFDRAALMDLHFLIFTLVQFFVFLGYLVPLFYIPTFAQVVFRTDESTSLYILVASQAASFFGRMGATLPVPYIGTMIPWVVCCGISGVLCFAWIATTSLRSFIAFSVLYGFFSGALVALPPGLFPVICPDPQKLGSRMGISWTFSAVSFLIGTPIAGVLVNIEQAELLGAQLWSGGMLLCSDLLLVLLWVLLTKKHNRVLI